MNSLPPNDGPPPPAPNSREELEARLTALALGEASEFEAETLRARLAADPELAALYRRLESAAQAFKNTFDDEHASALPPLPEIPEQLSPARRATVEKLFAETPAPAQPQIKVVSIPPTAKTPARRPILFLRNRVFWQILTAAACVALVVYTLHVPRIGNVIVTASKGTAMNAPEPASANQYAQAMPPAPTALSQNARDTKAATSPSEGNNIASNSLSTMSAAEMANSVASTNPREISPPTSTDASKENFGLGSLSIGPTEQPVAANTPPQTMSNSMLTPEPFREANPPAPPAAVSIADSVGSWGNQPGAIDNASGGVATAYPSAPPPTFAPSPPAGQNGEWGLPQNNGANYPASEPSVASSAPADISAYLPPPPPPPPPPPAAPGGARLGRGGAGGGGFAGGARGGGGGFGGGAGGGAAPGGLGGAGGGRRGGAGGGAGFAGGAGGGGRRGGGGFGGGGGFSAPGAAPTVVASGTAPPMPAPTGAAPAPIANDLQLGAIPVPADAVMQPSANTVAGDNTIVNLGHSGSENTTITGFNNPSLNSNFGGDAALGSKDTAVAGSPVMASNDSARAANSFDSANSFSGTNSFTYTGSPQLSDTTTATQEGSGQLATNFTVGGLGNVDLGGLSAGNDNTGTTYSGVLTGNGTFEKTGNGTLFVNGGTLDNSAVALTVGENTATLGGAISGSGFGLTQAGAGTLSYDSPYVFKGALNPASGTAAISSGAVQLSNGTASGTLDWGAYNGATAATGTAASDTPQLGTGGLIYLGGNISGAGNVTLQGGGLQWAPNTVNANLTNANLQYAAGQFGESETHPPSNGDTFDTNGNNLAFAGNVTGSGSLVKVGSGTLTLFGTNSYNGTTTLSAGTLNLDGSTTLQGGIFVSNGPTAFTGGALNSGSTQWALNEPSNGIDSLSQTKAGAGTLTLTGTNTYTGGTEITGGTLQLGSYNYTPAAGQQLAVSQGMESQSLSGPAIVAGKAPMPPSDDQPVARPASEVQFPPPIMTATNAFSTFALNVSDTAYQLARVALRNHRWPDPAATRTEEFLNAFQYHDPAPGPGEACGLNYDLGQNPVESDGNLLRVSFQTAATGRDRSTPLRLTILLDGSGSMTRADRVATVQAAVRALGTLLRPGDTVSLVTFARTATVRANAVPAEQFAQITDIIDRLLPDGGTNMEDALQTAYATARANFDASAQNRVILLTDGAANLGELEPAGLAAIVEQNRKAGIALDAYGVGWDGYDDTVLEALTRKSDGRYAFLNGPADVDAAFATKLAGALAPAAQDVKLQIEFNPQRVISYRLMGYNNLRLTQQQFRDNSVSAGELAAAEQGTALYNLVINTQGAGPIGTARVRYRDPGTTNYHELTWPIRYSGLPSAFDQAPPALRLATAAAYFAEYLQRSPFAASTSPRQLLGLLQGVPEAFAPDQRPAGLVEEITEAASLAGN